MPNNRGLVEQLQHICNLEHEPGPESCVFREAMLHISSYIHGKARMETTNIQFKLLRCFWSGGKGRGGGGMSVQVEFITCVRFILQLGGGSVRVQYMSFYAFVCLNYFII